jgi:hypothetical protein
LSLSSGGDDGGTPVVAVRQDALSGRDASLAREGLIACLLFIFAIVFNLYRHKLPRLCLWNLGVQHEGADGAGLIPDMVDADGLW